VTHARKLWGVRAYPLQTITSARYDLGEARPPYSAKAARAGLFFTRRAARSAFSPGRAVTSYGTVEALRRFTADTFLRIASGGPSELGRPFSRFGAV
jgi:hypothetical protein